jgi:uncharacterized protein YbbC (DUF1343 family)
MFAQKRQWLKPPKVKLGIDVLLESRRELLHGKRVGVITNHSGLTWDLRHMIDVFAEAEDINLVALYGPEHGVRGAAQAGEPIDSMVDPRTGVPVYSLFGSREKPTPEMVQGVDVLVFNIQSVGARFYTYGSTMSLCMQVAEEQGLEFIVLDRPNPITGEEIAGNILDSAYSSFVGMWPIAVRHGLTLGELARMVNEKFGVGCQLTVVEMEGWERSMWYDETGLSYIMTSPGNPSLDNATVYPGTCFFEGTNLAIGRGTVRPAELKGAPWIDGHEWADALNALDYPGVIFRAAYFTPWRGDYAGELCSGLQIHVVDREIYRPVETGLKMIEVVRKMYPDEFEWTGSTLVPGIPYWFDQLMGTDEVRKQMEAGIPIEEISAGWQPELQAYDQMRREYLLY